MLKSAGDRNDRPGMKEVSNQPLRRLGRHVEALYCFAEVAPDHGLRIAAVSLEGGLYVGILADPRLVPESGALARGIDAEVQLLRDRPLRP
jgi:WS/DGAT C-terminal domain